ncbi:hypothetical protein [Micromonospora sp. DT233]|uniref:hypothetical protein n=1 Tax=Micromonospora sp. DT233 TaxID=3393432 RepID=UPI003CE7223B
MSARPSVSSAIRRMAASGVGGVYCEDCAIVEEPGGADLADAARLWRLSAELTGVDAFATS